jgi:ankyrin repeat protein
MQKRTMANKRAATKLKHSNRGKRNVEDDYSFQTKKTVEEYHLELIDVCTGDSLSISSLSPLLEACPEAIQAHGETDTLLHHACYNNQVTREVVEYLVGLYPAAVETRTQWLPLHRACLNNAPSNVIDYLIDRYPEALRFEWDHSGLPLHCFLDQAFSLDKQTTNLDLYLVEKFISLYPEALRVQGEHYGTPLHVAVRRNDVSLELIQMLAHGEPTTLHLEHNSYLPIHILLCHWRCPPLEVVQFFVEQAPATLVHRANRGELPLHCACRDGGGEQNVTHDIIQLLIQACPASLAMASEFGNLPLHDACLHDNSSLEIVSLLVNENPDAVQSPNHFGMLPVDYACIKSLEITKLLISRYPESVKHTDHDGRLPIHGACHHGALEIVQFLFSLYPESIHHKTIRGDLPLHTAMKDEVSSLDVIIFLIENYPESIQEKDVKGNLPLHRVCECFSPQLLVIRLLFERFPEAIHTKNDKGRFPLHCACRSSKMSLEAVRFLISQLPYAAKVQDEDGLLPLHLVCKNRFSSQKEVEEELKYLIEIFPEGVRVNSPSYGLPIHCAAKRGNLNTVKYLESLYPESIEFNNESLGLPFNRAASKEMFQYLLIQRYQEYFNKRGIFPPHAIFQDRTIMKKAKVILRLFSHFPFYIRDTNSYTNKQGVTPLHLAVADTDVEASFVETLIGMMNSEAVRTPDYQGSIPLHYALRHGAFPDVVKLLLNLYPKGKYITDKLGNLPLHVACRHGASLEVVKIFVEDDEMSEQGLVTDGQGELPLHKACRGGHVSLVLFLMEKHLSSIRLKNSAGMLPVLLMCQSSGKRRATRETPEFLDAIWCLLKEHPDALLEALSS